MNKLIDEAEKARAADPTFLRDLRDLANSAASGMKLVLSDDFADGDFTQNPAWTVTQGEYFIERDWGLRNRVAQASDNANQNLSNEQKALALFGAILGGKVQSSGGSNSPEGTNIHTAQAVSNAFRVEAELYSVLTPGKAGIAVYQGSGRGAGYRLVYDAGRGLELQRFSSRGTSVIEATRQTLALEDKKFHQIEWTRGADGAMSVTVDGTEVIKAADRGFRDPFTGIELATRGGDFIIKKIALYGAQ